LFKTKYRVDGTIERKKDMLDIQGCRRQKGIYYEERFAHMAKMTVVRILLVVAAIKDWHT